MGTLSISLLGPLRVALDGEYVNRFEADTARALLAYLAMNVGTVFQRNMLAGLLWPDQSEPAARRNLRQALSRLRSAIGDREAAPPFLSVTHTMIHFNPASSYELDVDTFTTMLAAVQQHPHSDMASCLSCHRHLERAVELYRGNFLEGFEVESILFREWLVAKREKLHRQAIEALYQLAAYYESLGEYGKAQYYARRQVALEPWREEAHAQLIRTLALDDQRKAALDQYEECRRVLFEKLGVEPAREVAALYRQLSRTLFPPSPSSRRHNLPPVIPPPTRHMAEVDALVKKALDFNYRLLTVVGPAGVERTRLALAAASRVSDDFAQGVWLVPLSRDGAEENPGDPHDDLAQAMVDALDPEIPSLVDPKAYLLDSLRDSEILLILDDFDRFLSGADLLLEILRNAGKVTLLVTSRWRLNFQAEYVFRVNEL
jgi:DNA-binding SARP family transcriptional activator